MPRFTIQDNYGRELDIEGDVAPSDEKEIGNLFSEAEKSGFISPIYTPLFDKPSQKDAAFLSNSNLPQTQKSVANSTKVDSGKLLPSSAGIFPDMNTDNVAPSIMIEGYKPVDVTATAPTSQERYDYVSDIENNPELKKYYQSIPQPESVQYSPRVLQMKKEGKPIGVSPEAMRKGEEYLAGLSAAEFTNLSQEGRLLTSLGKGGLDVLAGVSSAMEWAGIDKAKPITQRMDSWAKEIAPYNPNFAEKLMAGLGSQMVYLPLGFGAGSMAQVIGKFSPKIASLFGTSVSTLLEAGTEAGLVYKEMLDGGKSVEEASRSARDVFAANIPLDFITNKLGAFAGAEKQGIKRMVGGFVSEGVQEGGQEAISNVATGKPIGENVAESALIGGVLGGGTGAVTRGFEESEVRGKKEELRNQNVGGRSEKMERPFGFAQGQTAQGGDVGQGGKFVGAENLPLADAEELAKGRVVPVQDNTPINPPSSTQKSNTQGGIKKQKTIKRSEKEITNSFNDLLELEKSAPEKLTERQKEDIDFIKQQRIDGRPDAETQQVMDLQETFENQSSEIRSQESEDSPFDVAQGKEKLTEVPTELPTETNTPLVFPSQEGKGNDVELSDTRVYDVPLKNIGTRPELQNRETAFSEESVKNIVENFDANKLEPIVVWQDSKSGEFITANHSRFEAFKRMGKENIPARIFKGSYKEFVDFAKNSNVLGTPESLLERAKYYRSQRAEGMDEKALRELARNQEKKNANTILSFSYLNPKGKLLESVKQLENSDQQNRNAINTMAEWVGEVRKRNPELTNAHENELFDFLKGQYGNVGARNKTEFLERVNGAIQKQSVFGEFNSSQPLNLKNFASKSANESAFDEQIAAAEQEYKSAQKSLDAKREEFLLRKASPQQLESALKPYSDRVTVAQRELLNLQNTKADALRNIRQSEMSLFDSDVKSVGVEKAIENVRERVVKANNKEELAAIFKEQFGLDDERATANAVIYDATANALAQQLGKGKEYLYGKLGFGQDINQQLSQKKQGAVKLSEYGDDVITAMTSPNVSTPVHELSHVYLKDLLVASRDGVADFRDDLRVVLKNYNENVRGRKIKGEVFVNIEKGIDELLKNPAGSSGRIKDVQEFFARGFEKYLAEGEKAGFSKRMNEIFAKFKMWLSDIYNGISGSAIDLELNDGMEKVFGKMVGMEKVEGRSEKEEVRRKDGEGEGEGEGVLYQELIDEIKNEALQLPENERSKFIRDEFIRRRKNATQKSSTEQVVKEDTGLQKIKNKFRKGFDVLREQIQDNFLRVKKLVEDPSMKVTEKSNPYDAEILFHGRVGARIEDVQNTVNNISNDILKTSKDIGVEDSVLRNDVNNYLLSLHAPERNARLYNGAAGITTEEAKTLLEDLRNKEYFQDVQRIAGDISSLNKKTLEILHDGEVISDGAYTSMTETYKNHVPLQRIFDDTENINDVLISKGYDVRSSGIRRAKGSSRDVADILTNVVANVEQAIVRSEKNLVDLQTLRFARDNKQSGLFEEIKPKSIGKDFNGNLIFEKIKDENVLQLREKGKPVYLKINDPNLASSLRGVGNEQLPSYIKLIGNFTRFYSGLLTRFNPEFLFSNKIRDLQELMVFALSQGELGKKRVRKILAKDRQSIKDVYDYIRGNDTDGARLYNQMRLDGGTTGGMSLSTRKNLELDLQKFEKINKSSPRKALKMIFETIDAVNTIFEDSSRLSVYKNALENGLSRGKAAILAKNSTINFNKKGRATPIINSLWMFSNASVQGSAKMLIAMKDPKVAVAVTSIVGLLSFLINGWNDKLDPKWRDKVSKFNRNSNFTIMLPTTDGVRYFALPISWGLKPMKVTADYVYDATTGNLDNFKSAFGNIASTFIDAYNPIGGSDVPSAIMPTILDIPLDIWRNKKFTGSPIKPLNYGKKPKHELYFKSLPETIPGKVAISGTEMLSNIGLEVSPADVVYAYNQYIGGAGGFGGRIMNSIYSIGKGELPQAREVPFLNRFYKDVPQEELNRFNKDDITKKGISRIDFLKRKKKSSFTLDN